MICKSCGAKYDDKEAKCPFCGSMNEKGSKRLFFRKLLGITDTIGDMSEQPKKVLLKNTVAALCAAAACILIGISIALSVRYHDQKQKRAAEVKEEKEKVEELTWENETFPMLDEWYEKGEYSSIHDFSHKLLDEDSKYNIYRWRHYSFLEIYDDYYDVEQYIKQEQSQNDSGDINKEIVLEKTLELIYTYSDEKLEELTPKDPEHSREGLTQEELVIIAGFKENAQIALTDLLGVTKEEQEELRQQGEYGSYYSACYDYAKKKGW